MELYVLNQSVIQAHNFLIYQPTHKSWNNDRLIDSSPLNSSNAGCWSWIRVCDCMTYIWPSSSFPSSSNSCLETVYYYTCLQHSALLQVHYILNTFSSSIEFEIAFLSWLTGILFDSIWIQFSTSATTTTAYILIFYGTHTGYYYACHGHYSRNDKGGLWKLIVDCPCMS